MPLFHDISNFFEGRGRFLAVLIVHVPIILVIIGTMPMLLIAAPIAPSRYQHLLGSVLDSLSAWSRSALESLKW